MTGAFALWGSKIAGALGVAVASWTYWAADPAPLQQSILADTTTVTNFGIILGALVAAAVGGTFVIHKRIPLKTVVAVIIGGILMSYGARLAYGCNIGAYFGDVARSRCTAGCGRRWRYSVPTAASSSARSSASSSPNRTTRAAREPSVVSAQ